jgi:hypothetical protein
LFGIIEDPVENESAARTNPKRGLDHQVISSASRLRCLDHEVAIGDAVQGVGGHAVETHFGRGRFAIQRIARPGQRSRTQRRNVGPAATVSQPTAIAFQHLHVGEQVVGEKNRLGRLNVSHPGQHGFAVANGQTDERPFHFQDRAVQTIDRPTQP